MKRGHYYNQAEKAFKILDKFHHKMFEIGGEESEYWSDDFNSRESDLRRSLQAGKDDESFVLLEHQDRKMNTCDLNIQDYRDQIKYCRKRIAEEQTRKDKLQKEKQEMIVEFDMDYKTIEKRLLKEFPEFAP